MKSAHVFSNPDLQVFFVDASSQDRIKEDYQAIIRSRGTAYRTFTYEGAIQWFTGVDKPWLIIADNVDDPTVDLRPFIPRNPRGHFIITSQNASLGLIARTRAHHIEALDTEDSIKLLLDISGCEPNDINKAYAVEIVIALGHLPLAIAQAASYIYKHKCLSTYLELYRESKKELLSQGAKELPHRYNLSVATTLEMSFHKLSLPSKAVLLILSFLQNTSISHRIIVEAAKNCFFYASGKAKEADKVKLDEIKQESKVLCDIFSPKGQWSEVEFNRIIEPCFQYSLLQSTTSTDDQKFYSMHILVQSWLQLQPDPDGRPSSTCLARRMLLASVKEDSSYQYLSFHQMILPHLRSFAGTSVGVATDEILMYQALADTGDTATAHIHLMAYLNMAQNQTQWDSLEWLEAKYAQTACLVELGRYREALEACMETTELCVKALGKENPLTLRTMSNMALIYSNMGEYRRAREMNEDILTIRKEVLGTDHWDTLRSINNLATNHNRLGHYEEAGALYETSLLLAKTVLGPEHPGTLVFRNNLACNYINLSLYKKARYMNEETLSLCKRVLGAEHPDTLFAMSNVAAIYGYLGWNEKARERNEQIVSLRSKVLGPDHPDTLTSMCNLSGDYRRLKMYERARETADKTLNLRKRVLGPEHPDTLQSMNDLALDYSNLGWYEKSQEINEETLSLRKRVLGPRHPVTLESLCNLAADYSNRKLYEKCCELYEEIVAISKKVLGQKNPDTLLYMNNLSINYKEVGQYEKAQQIEEEAIRLATQESRIEGRSRSTPSTRRHPRSNPQFLMPLIDFTLNSPSRLMPSIHNILSFF
jgi:tetratricopeptide (TPR) repeat protein